MGPAGTALTRGVHRGNLLVADGILVFLVTVLALSTLIYRAIEGPEILAGAIQFDFANAISVALLLAGLSSLIWRRPPALPVLMASIVIFALYDLAGSASPLLAFAPLMALYAVAANSRPVVSGGAAAALAVGAVAVFLANTGPLDDDILDYLLSVATAWLLGYGVWLNRARTSLLADQAAQLTREQAAQTQTAVRQEQTRIARELHDIVAHRVVVMVAQAGASTRMFDADPQRARHALKSIEILGREALTEMRRLLGVLWTHDEGSKAPQPGLADLPDLIAQIERAGLPVELRISGQPRTLPAGVELSAYRIVQEALTNTLKHAGPARADVELRYHPDLLEVRVDDDGQGSSSLLKAGQGVVSMRQRAALVGGEVSLGPRSGTGFQVAAKLPLNGEP
ncbi:MAG TPA: histidine kinase [Jiangellaceae bacterium]|jgi:signal transduction histidine kinase|nr:histidine kinase [Jiangellaceae bacterium]